MRTKLFIGSATAVVLAIAAVAFAGAFTKAAPTVTPEPAKIAQPSAEANLCCTLDDCCLECILCCADDGCCDECIQCCIEMGCDPFCCFPALTGANAEALKTGEAGSTKLATKTSKGCCSDGCCK